MSKHSDFDIGDSVAWDWGAGTAEGRITERFTSTVTRTIKGTEETRNASANTPAYLIEQADGDFVLELCTELRAA
jgi:hypothetical protein